MAEPCPRDREIGSRLTGGRTDRLLAWLMLAEWILAIVVAAFVSPDSWRGISGEHPHVMTAVVLGGVINVLPLGFAFLRPGRALTHHVMAIGLILWSALFIHLTRGQFGTRFHPFLSLGIIALYRDFRVLISPSFLVIASHLARLLFSPVTAAVSLEGPGWLFVEYVGWLVYEDLFLWLSIRVSVQGTQELARRQAELETTNASIERLVEERTRELEASREQYRSLVETTHAVACELDPETFQILYVGPQAEKILGYTPDECLGDRYAKLVHPDDLPRLVATCEAAARDEGAHQTEYRVRSKDGHWLWIRTSMSLSRDRVGRRLIRSMNLDVTSEKQLEVELRQAQKLESVGRLAAGVAHEINTPIQFVSDSTHFVKDSLVDLTDLLEKYRAFRAELEASGRLTVEEGRTLDQAESDADIEYLMENLPQALDRALEGLGRVTVIVRSMKEFAHPDAQERVRVDLNRAIESTLTIAKNEYKYVADLEMDLGTLPQVWCFPGEINQVILNLVVNAAHAIADVVKDTGEKGRITVRTRSEGGFAVVEIADTGTGIPESARASIFDPFFTTKAVGKGTGQGLAIARSVVVEKHGGMLEFDTEMGKGTKFFVCIPIAPPAEPEAEAEAAE